MNRDLWCADLTGDGNDEILAANADGHLYCLDAEGNPLWKFRPSQAPMNSVATLTHEGTTVVVCGGYDKNIYWLSAKGEPIKTVPSSSYSIEKVWGKKSEKKLPNSKEHIANFLRPAEGENGQDILVLHAAINSNSGNGSLYLFQPLAEHPFKVIKKPILRKPSGDLSLCDTDGDGIEEVLLGSSSTSNDGGFLHIDLQSSEMALRNFQDLRKEKALREKMKGLAYRVAQTLPLGPPPHKQFLTAFGSRFVLSPADLNAENTEVIVSPYSFNDIWKDPRSNKILLASIQSGGSGIHILDPSQPDWKNALENFQPTGKIARVLSNTQQVREQLQLEERPSVKTSARKVYFLTEALSGELEQHALELEKEHGNPVFLQGQHMNKVEDWDRVTVTSELYREKRDRRKSYVLSPEEALDQLSNLYQTTRSGVSYWGGHGNDPYMFSSETLIKALANHPEKKTVLIYPELEKWNDDFAMVLDDHIYPLASTFQGTENRLYIRTKHAFWHSIVYEPLWSRLLSGEFADVFVPSMEETTDKTPEQTVPSRVGIWASGAVNQWGSRVVRDNPSFDRLRQHSDQMLPNHFLRNQIYHLSLGATYLNNFAIDQDYFSVLYDLIAQGVLYVPARNEIVSFNPVHLGMTRPDPFYLDEGNNAKWVTFFDEEEEAENPRVFSRLNGTWPGAPVHEWDYSSFAAGVKDRRLNYLPPFENGVVLIAPAQSGKFANPDAPRGRMVDHLHPLYRETMHEFITNGREYLSPDGTESYPADQHYQSVAQAIAKGAELLPLTVAGEVAWTVAQTAPDRLRLTVIDGGYLNPSRKQATITFRAARAKAMTDLLSGETTDLKGKNSAAVEVPSGLFRFYDVELTQPFHPKK